MEKREVIQRTVDHVKSSLEKNDASHDWYHIQRVRDLAAYIGRSEKAEAYIVELGALLHDIKDWKFSSSSESGYQETVQWLFSLKVDSATIASVGHIVDNISFKGADEANQITSLEGKVVQDADRLDAIGAIGIARCFSYGGSKGTLIYDPAVNPGRFDKPSYVEAAIEGKGTSINHFDEKLLLLKDRMNTQTGRLIAEVD